MWHSLAEEDNDEDDDSCSSFFVAASFARVQSSITLLANFFKTYPLSTHGKEGVHDKVRFLLFFLMKERQREILFFFSPPKKRMNTASQQNSNQNWFNFFCSVPVVPDSLISWLDFLVLKLVLFSIFPLRSKSKISSSFFCGHTRYSHFFSVAIHCTTMRVSVVAIHLRATRKVHFQPYMVRPQEVQLWP